MYVLRLGVIIISALIFLLAVRILLSVPAYLYLHGNEANERVILSGLSQKLATQQDQVAIRKLTALNSRAELLTVLAHTPLASVATRLLLGVSRTEVTLKNIAYTAPRISGDMATMSISGIAHTREALRTYQLALRAAPFIASVDLPVDAYAKDTDIPFTITLTGPFAP